MEVIDILIIIPILFLIGFIYGFYRLSKFILKKSKTITKNFETDSTDKFISNQETLELSGKFDAIVKKLEVDRLAVNKKTKGLYKRSFLRIWGIMGGTSIALLLFSGDEIHAGAIIVLTFMTAVVAAIGSGIYTLIRKSTILDKFTAKLKKELVSEVVKYVNPNLTFYDEGIETEDFKNADLFNGDTVKSEDTIEGIIDGHQVVISECTSYYKGGESGDIIYFNGIFVILNLSNIEVSTPIKIIPSRNSSSRLFDKQTGIRKRHSQQKLKINDIDLVSIDPSLKKSNYEFYCPNQEVVNSFVNETNLKILGFIFDKYENQRESLFKDIPFLRDINLSSGVYISIVKNKLYLALDWNEDMFEPDKFLNKSLIESGIAQRIYKDLLFINQVVKEVHLIDKVNG